MPELQLKLKLEKETKNTYRFSSGMEGSAIQTVYIEKDAFASKPSEVSIVLSGETLKSV